MIALTHQDLHNLTNVPAQVFIGGISANLLLPEGLSFPDSISTMLWFRPMYRPVVMFQW